MPFRLVSLLLGSRLTPRVPTRIIELNRYHNHGGDHAEPCTPDGVFALSQLAPSHGARQGGKRLFIRLVLTLTIVTISLHPAWARLQEGYDAVSRGDKEQALQELRTRAEGGNARAQVVIGILYAEGRGVPKDEQESVRWYKLAAAQGEAKAQRRVGYHYAVGRGAPRIIRKRYVGIVSRRSRAMQTLNTTWGICTTRARVCHKTLKRRASGMNELPCKARPVHN